MSKHLPPKPMLPSRLRYWHAGVRRDTKYINEWYEREIRPVFEPAIEVTGIVDENGANFSTVSQDNHTHKALLVKVRPITDELSSADILKEIITAMQSPHQHSDQHFTELIDKAKVILAREGSK